MGDRDDIPALIAWVQSHRAELWVGKPSGEGNRRWEAEVEWRGRTVDHMWTVSSGERDSALSALNALWAEIQDHKRRHPGE